MNDPEPFTLPKLDEILRRNCHGWRDKPNWLPYVTSRLSDLAEGSKVDPEALNRSLEVLNDLLSAETPTPSVVPSEDRGVEFVWHKSGWDVAIEVLPGETFIWVSDRESGESWSGSPDDCKTALVIALRDMATSNRI